MSLNVKFGVGVLLVLFTSTAFADPSFRGLYFGGGFARHDVKDIDDIFNGAVIKVGLDLTNFLGIEIHGGATNKRAFLGSDAFGSGVVEARTEHAGVYARLGWRSPNSMIYGLIGTAFYRIHGNYTSFTDSSLNYTFDNDVTGLSYGIGAELFGSGRTSITANIMQVVLQKDEYDYEWDVRAVYIGVTHYLTTQKTTHATY